MEILGIGPLELFFIVIIALLVLGPKDMVRAGRSLGRFLRRLVMSPAWRTVQDTSRELRTLPNRLIREAGLEELEKDLKIDPRSELGIDQLEKDMREVREEMSHDLSEWTTLPEDRPTPGDTADSTISRSDPAPDTDEPS